MDSKISNTRAFVVVALIISLLCLLSACEQSGDKQSAESAAVESSVATESATSPESTETDEEAEAPEDESSEAAGSSKSKTKQSFLDAARGVADKAKEAADTVKEKATEATEAAKEKATEAAGAAKERVAEVADAAAKAKEEADRKAEERKKQQEEEAKARTAEELAEAKLTRTTKVLEYSSKKAKPLKLVECSDDDIEVASKGKIDLTELGNKKVAYTLTLDGQSVQRNINFKIRDTKPPKIDFVSRKPKVDLGDSYDPIQNINYVKDPVDGQLELVDEAPVAQGSKAGKEIFYDKGWYTVEGYVDTSVAGMYTIDVNASDIHGNTAHRSFDVTVVAPEPEPGAAPAAHSYVLNKNTHKFHTPGCGDVRKMSDWNRWDVTMTREEVMNMGYEPCGHCHP